MVKSLHITFQGRLLGKKNHHQIHRLGQRMTIGLSREAKDQIAELKTLAMVAVAESGWDMPPDKTRLGVRYTQWCSSVRSGDIDNAATTALDAFQGIVYANDMYIVELSGRKVIFDKKRFPELDEKTEFEIYVIEGKS